MDLVDLHNQFPEDKGLLFNLQDDSLELQGSNSLIDWIKNRLDQSKHYPEQEMTLKQQIERQGLKYEEHSVTTKDGYILTMQRIRKQGLKFGAPVVLCLHGLFSQADTWIDNDPSVAVAFRLANAGYEVWLGNNRGNVYSLGHTKLDYIKNPQEYFDYSFQELGEYDLPVLIETALNVSKVKKLAFMGHSEGTTQMFYALSQHEDSIASKVNLFIACAPIVRFKNAPLAIQLTKWFGNPTQALFNINNQYSLFGKDFIDDITNFSNEYVIGALLFALISVISGSPKYNDDKWFDIAFAWSPARGSVKEVIHYSQLIHSGTF